LYFPRFRIVEQVPEKYFLVFQKGNTMTKVNITTSNDPQKPANLAPTPQQQT
jgi:hypothetical protein